MTIVNVRGQVYGWAFISGMCVAVLAAGEHWIPIATFPPELGEYLPAFLRHVDKLVAEERHRLAMVAAYNAQPAPANRPPEQPTTASGESAP